MEGLISSILLLDFLSHNANCISRKRCRRGLEYKMLIFSIRRLGIIKEETYSRKGIEYKIEVAAVSTGYYSCCIGWKWQLMYIQ
jgi:hypothetical protein